MVSHGVPTLFWVTLPLVGRGQDSQFWGHHGDRITPFGDTMGQDKNHAESPKRLGDRMDRIGQHSGEIYRIFSTGITFDTNGGHCE